MLAQVCLIPNAPAPESLRALTHTMITAIDSRPVAQEAIRRLGLEMSAAKLPDNLTIEQNAGTSFIRLTYKGSDPVAATKIVNTVSEVSSERITGTGSEELPLDTELTATVYDKASVPDAPASPKPLRNGLIALVVGLALVGVARLAIARRT